MFGSFIGLNFRIAKPAALGVLVWKAGRAGQPNYSTIRADKIITDYAVRFQLYTVVRLVVSFAIALPREQKNVQSSY